MTNLLIPTNYVLGNYSKFGEDYLQRVYPSSPGISKPKNDVYATEDKIIVGNPWTEEIIATFDNEEDFFNFCDEKSGAPASAWSQGMFDG